MTSGWCASCRVSRPWASRCPACGTPLRTVDRGRDQRGPPRPRRGLVDAAVLAAAEAPRLVESAYGERRPTSGNVSLHGASGSGKSTLLVSESLSLAHRHGIATLLICSEEGTAPTVAVRLRRAAALLGVAVSPLVTLSDASTGPEADRDIARWAAALGRRPGVVAVDSLTHLRSSDAWWQRLIASPWGSIFVLHLVTSGVPRGGFEVDYAVDHVIFVEAGGRAWPIKSRWGPTGESMAFDVHRPNRLDLAPPADAVLPFEPRSKS